MRAFDVGEKNTLNILYEHNVFFQFIFTYKFSTKIKLFQRTRNPIIRSDKTELYETQYTSNFRKKFHMKFNFSDSQKFLTKPSIRKE